MPISVDTITELMIVEDGLNNIQINEILSQLSSVIIGVIYGYTFKNEMFRSIEPLGKSDLDNPTLEDVMFAKTHFDKEIQPYYTKPELFELEIPIDEFQHMFEKIFLPREINVFPIITYLAMLEKIDVYNNFLIVKQKSNDD